MKTYQPGTEIKRRFGDKAMVKIVKIYDDSVSIKDHNGLQFVNLEHLTEEYFEFPKKTSKKQSQYKESKNQK